MNNVGLTIVEGVANGASAYKDPSKRNIGLLGQFIRGASLKPQLVQSMEAFNNIFGGQSASFYGPAIVKSIFDEADEAKVTLYIARVTGTGAAVATASAVALSDSKTMTVKAGYKGNDDPGAWANGITATLYSYGSLVRDMFTLIVKYDGKQVEQYNYGTLAEIQTAVNRISGYITISFTGEITKLNLTAVTGTITCTTSSNAVTGTGTDFTDLTVGQVLYTNDTTPRVIGTIAAIADGTHLTLVNNAQAAVTGAACKVRTDSTYIGTLANGADGTVTENDFYPVEGTNPKGLACFDGYDIQILVVTEFHTLTMATALNTYLNKVKNPIGVVNLPLNADEGVAELYADTLQTNETSYLAGYLGWCKVPDENGNPITIPVIGPVLGAAYLRTPYLNGDFIHIPPGGTDSTFHNVLEMVPERLSQASINKLVQQLTCNIIQNIEGVGFYVGSSRTYSVNPLYNSIHIRLQTSYYRRVLQARMRFMEQKPNTPELKREALASLYAYFKTEYDNGALERSVDFNVAYKGICDKSNNPASQDRKLINIDVLWIPTECTEAIRISLQRNDGILTTEG